MLTVASIHLSTLDLAFGSLVFGSPVAWRGHHATLRVAALDPHIVDFVGPLKVRAQLQGGSALADAVLATDDDVVTLRVPIPTDAPDEVRVALEIEAPEGREALTVNLEVVDTPQLPGGLFLSHHENTLTSEGKRKKSTATTRLAFYPEGGHVVAGLTNHVTGRVSTDGAPVSIAVASQRPVVKTRSDDDGLFHFSYIPVPTQKPLRFVVGEAPAVSIDVPLEPRPSQVLLRDAGPVVRTPGEAITLMVDTLPFRDPVHVDLWLGNILFSSQQLDPVARRDPFEVQLPKGFEGWARVTAYRDFSAADDSASHRLYWVVSDPSAAQVQTDLLGALQRIRGGDPIVDAAVAAQARPDATTTVRRLSALAVGRLKPKKAGPPMLLSTLESGRKAIEQRRDRLRAQLHRMLLWVVIFAAALAVALLLRQQLRLRNAVNEVLDEGERAGEDVGPRQRSLVADARQLYELALAFGAILLFAYCLYVLLGRMIW